MGWPTGSEPQLEGLDSRSGSSTSRRGRKRSAAEQWSYARSAVGAVLRFRYVFSKQGILLQLIHSTGMV